MKTIVKRLVRDEKGAALILALILLLIGGLMSAALLNHMGSGIIAGVVHERRTAELYAADAGVEDAIWRLPSLGLCLYQSTNYTITDMNDKTVQVFIDFLEPGIYKVTSIAITDGDGDGGVAAIDSATAVEAYITGVSVCDDYSGILDGILTSQGELDWKDKVILTYTEGHEPAENYAGAWPDDAEEVNRLALFYRMDVKDEPEFGLSTVDIGGADADFGPVYRDGELTIKNSVKTDPPPTLSLNGTIYITGNTLIGTTEKDFTLDLNGQTIFVVSSSADRDKALWIGGHCTIRGPGCIIAIGDIYFEPNPDVGAEEEPVFLLSVLGATTMRPGIDMHGAIAGSVAVDVQSGSKPQISYPVGGFEGLINFPGFVETKLTYSIESWEIIQQ